MEDDSLIGQQLGVYLIQAKLGEGGMARVYKAYHPRLRRDVAIKVILPQKTTDLAGFQARFEREAQMSGRLVHPNIVAVHDFGEQDNLTYLVMQYVGGGTLRDQLHEKQPLDPKRAAHYALQMARALHHAHSHGIVHRDVKPQNMLVSASDSTQLLLSDFGIAKLFTDRQNATASSLIADNLATDPMLTQVGQVVGTADYMAPEQIQGEPVDGRTDVYALGVVLYQMLTGEVPFRSTTVQGILFQHVYATPKPVREVNPSVPEALAQITAKALAKAPDDRFPSAEAMAQALEIAVSSVTNPVASSPLFDNYAASGSSSGYRTPPAQSRFTETSPPDTVISPFHSTHQSLAVHPRSTRKFRGSYLAVTLLLLLAMGVILVRLHPFSGSTSAQQTTSGTAQSFIEDFQTNDRNWTVGTTGRLTAMLEPTKYTLTIGNAPQTYFPNPAAVGVLPARFTLTATIIQTQGSPTVPYGLAFRFKHEVSGVSCYAFVIDGNTNYEVLKYNPVLVNKYTTLWSGQSSAIKGGLNQSNRLQVSIQGGTFSFHINGQRVPIELRPIDTTAYTGGHLGLLVAGPDASFDVPSVQLAIP